MFKNNVQKVWKSTIAYLVGSIAFIQLAPVFFATFPPEEMFGSSAEEIMPFLFILVALGFPLIIGLSFYFIVFGRVGVDVFSYFFDDALYFLYFF